ncbi:MAG: hypothetical protein Q8942_03260, partial [Bacillota bacterium]|nr:hypothetical protein [Bacillota bacterium]
KWQNHISDIVSKQCATLNYIKEMFKNKLYNEEWVIDIRQVEDLFLYCILDLEKTPFDKLNSFMSDMRNHNWQACLHGRKLYFIPKPINKWNAVEYLKDMLPDKIIAASGDSYMDFELLEMADYKVLPFHGEVCNKFSPGDTCLRTKTEGLSASLEILEIIESFLKFS